MSYNAKGNRPFEWASKSQHTHVINDPSVQNLMKRCKFPLPMKSRKMMSLSILLK